MRIPLPVQFKTRQGNVTKDARIKNGYVEIKGEVGRVRKRPGVDDLGLVSETGQASLMACVSLSPAGGSLTSLMGDTVLTRGDNFWEIDAAPWDSGTTYSYGDWVFYANQYWSSIGAGVGVAPGGAGWRAFGFLLYDPDATYEIGDDAQYAGETWYAMKQVQGVTPAAPYWSLTPPTSARYIANFTGLGEIGAICGSPTAAGASAMDAWGHTTCATQNPGGSWASFSYATSTQFFVQQWSSSFDCSINNYHSTVQYGTIRTL